MGLPVRSERVKSGASLAVDLAVCLACGAEVGWVWVRSEGVLRPRDRRSAKGRGFMRLAAFGGGIALVDPVGAEVFGEVEDLEVGVAEGTQERVGGGDVGAAAPGAAAAVEDDGGVFGEVGDAVAEGLEAGGLAGGPGVLGAGDVGFGEEDVGAYLKDERLVGGGGFEGGGEFGWLEECGGGDGGCRGVLGVGCGGEGQKGEECGEEESGEVGLHGGGSDVVGASLAGFGDGELWCGLDGVSDE